MVYLCEQVRDLLSPMGEEKQYKTGMRKDPDGFMDIDWCSSKAREYIYTC